MQCYDELKRSSNRALREHLIKVNQGRLGFDCPEPELPFEWARDYTPDIDYSLDFGRFIPADAADQLSRLFRREFGITLDLTLSSLLEVDEKLYNTGLFKDFIVNVKRETPFDYDRIFASAVWLGSFLGECIAKSLRLSWKIRRNIFESSIVRGEIELFPLLRAARILSTERFVSPIECSLSQFFWFASQSQEVFANEDTLRLKESLRRIYAPYERREEYFRLHAPTSIGELTDENLLTTDSKCIFVWNVNGTLIDHIPYHEYGEMPCWMGGDATIASANMYGDVWLWDANTKVSSCRSERSSTPTSALCKFSNRHLAWGCKNGKLFSWNTDDRVLTEFGKIPAAVTFVAAAGERLAVSNGTKNIYLFDILKRGGKALSIKPVEMGAIHQKQVYALSGSQRFRIFSSAGKDRRVVIWRPDQSQVFALDCAAVPVAAQLSEMRYMVGTFDEDHRIKLIDLDSQSVVFDQNLRDFGIPSSLAGNLGDYRTNCLFSPSFTRAVIALYEGANRLKGALIVDLEKKTLLACTESLHDRAIIPNPIAQLSYQLEPREPPKKRDVKPEPLGNNEAEDEKRRRWLKKQSKSIETLRKLIAGNYGQGRVPKFSLNASDFHWLILELRREDALSQVQIVLENLSKDDLKEHLKRSAYSEGIHAELNLGDVLSRPGVVSKIDADMWSEIESAAANPTMASIVQRLRR
jgi:WD40 repeat protein